MIEQRLYESVVVEAASDAECGDTFEVKVAAIVDDDGPRVLVGTLEFTVTEARALAASLIVAASCAALEVM